MSNINKLIGAALLASASMLGSTEAQAGNRCSLDTPLQSIRDGVHEICYRGQPAVISKATAQFEGGIPRNMAEVIAEAEAKMEARKMLNASLNETETPPAVYNGIMGKTYDSITYGIITPDRR